MTLGFRTIGMQLSCRISWKVDAVEHSSWSWSVESSLELPRAT